MNPVLVRRFNHILNTMSDQKFLLTKIAYETAPTLAGIKPATLLTFGRNSRNLFRLWEGFKYQVGPVLGLRYFELRKSRKHVSVLFYDRDMLEKIVADGENKAFLRDMDYHDDLQLDRILRVLRSKVAIGFPHEIGLLLGIPRTDVAGFIENRGEKSLFCGYWKVYHNPRQAAMSFAGYDMAKRAVMNWICETERLDDMPGIAAAAGWEGRNKSGQLEWKAGREPRAPVIAIARSRFFSIG